MSGGSPSERALRRELDAHERIRSRAPRAARLLKDIEEALAGADAGHRCLVIGPFHLDRRGLLEDAALLMNMRVERGEDLDGLGELELRGFLGLVQE